MTEGGSYDDTWTESIGRVVIGQVGALPGVKSVVVYWAEPTAIVLNWSGLCGYVLLGPEDGAWFRMDL